MEPRPEVVEAAQRLFLRQKAQWRCPKCGAAHLGDPKCKSL